MTKKELQTELISRIKCCEKAIDSYDECSDSWTYARGRKDGLKLALQLIEYLNEGKA